MKPLKITLAFQLLFFAGWGAYLFQAHAHGTTVLLETSPVDPRDWISGHYVTLRYPIGEAGDCPYAGKVWIRLEQDGAYWKRRECSSARRDDGLWLRGTRRGPFVSFDIERFYVNEDSSLRAARSGTVAAKVSINAAGLARVLELVPAPR